MDFRRIEWIFFVVFLGLDLFLFGIYHEGIKNGTQVSRTDRTETIEHRLKKDNITYKGKLSTKKQTGYYLGAEQTNFKELTNEKNLPKTVNTIEDNLLIGTPLKNFFIDEKNVKNSLKPFLKDSTIILNGLEYVYLPDFSVFKKDTAELIASQQYKKIPFYDDTAQLTISLEKTDDLMKISKYSQMHIDKIEELRDKVELYSKKEIIENLYMNNKIPNNTQLTFIKLAYSKIYKIHEKNVYVPVWFVGIKTSDGNLQVEHINAISNTIITNNSIPKVENH
ncbi:two-component system regulatory protein YycI [Melissococcus plutonius]|uniref:Regulatory protein YycH-like domain-containing protein n=1 Tax=Melissococcus plutonius TaxID=33970 RepID=A0A2Z5Y1T3_9ENTE|nr:two-component system regulatory protein YycI [Melissococcus plutonius]BAL61899.1 hypothetical protein MPD5_0648 [Melissococcus plutonius DAT561]MCV2499496.1 two-component system regulatory protein YycI [Melissococcus plutonius]MCV2501133.1 two-component system regulatory protein YycI [Melissococcus plutonius]MCV2505763.1 two-component system regulatory protein YycI [Melissococcus plutonius]MCV2508019.1 two-component system regulatory protein YycI [Melissococcus plutonius]